MQYLLESGLQPSHLESKRCLDNRMGEDVDFLAKVAEHFPAKINSTSSIVAIKQIKEKLTEAQLAIFRTTCFGKLLVLRGCMVFLRHSPQIPLKTIQCYVSNKKRKHHENKENDGIRQYALHGFPYAFQIWACEVIPAIGVEIANKSGTLLPRIVNWITPRTPDATNVIKLLDRKNTQVFKKLQPTSRERGEEYVKFLFSPQVELDPSEVGGEDEEDMLASNGSENYARGGAAENCLENASVLQQLKSKRVCVDCKANNEENTRKLDALGKRIDQMDKKLDLIINL
ncbi:hypothetical protein Dsin_000733 [Dipteronia sinensis]|uniref:Uncharacterized protein n=1 Tax=Dipteronia sinensis TaxID=43782 RepID=A0AAE0B3S7_9ROSI|nr:hypothetical protein Dsin_000733 [Dipteronia sinensis]